MAADGRRERLAAWAHEERWVLAVVAVASVAAFITWGGVTRPMEDTVDYRAAVEMLRAGWAEMPDRAPGYPLILMATGSGRSSTTLLFLAQLAAHAVAVLLVVDLARRVAVGGRGRLALAALLMAPPVVMKSVYEGTEVWAELAVAAIVWLLVRWDGQRRTGQLVAVGTALGLLTWVRPGYQLLVVPLALAVGLLARRQHPGRAAVTLALPAMVIVGGLVAANGVRFGTPLVDRLLPYHLSEKTTLFVEELPADEEPVRSILLARRDHLLVNDPEHSPAAFAFDSRPALEAATGLTGADLDREMLRLDLLLISQNPLSYLWNVELTAVSYVQIDAQQAAYGGWDPASWALSAMHLVLAVAFLAVALLVPGVALARGMDRQILVTTALSWLVVLYTGVVTVMIVNGEARVRSPTDPLLALLLVSGASWLGRQPLGRRRPRSAA